jgi:hypothetical protein
MGGRSLPVQQAKVILRLGEVFVIQKRGGRSGWGLDGKDCSQQVASLLVKGIIEKAPSGSLQLRHHHRCDASEK